MKQIPNQVFFAWVEDEILSGRPVRLRMKGNSMFPLLRSQKDEVLLYPCPSEDLRPKDVVLFRYRGNHLLHRVILRDGNRLLLQGDGSYVAKEECLVDDVVAKVTGIIRPSGRVIPVDNWRWKVPSYLWPKAGMLRTVLLRIFGHK